MANLNRLFKVNISRQSRAASYANFGIGLIAALSPGFYGLTAINFESAKLDDVKRLTQVYSSYDDVIEAGVTGAALSAANRYFAQTPTPDQLVMADISEAYSSTAILLNGKDTGIPQVTAAIAIVVGDSILTATFQDSEWEGTAAESITIDENNTSLFRVAGRVVFVSGADVSLEHSTVGPEAYAPAIVEIKRQNNNWFLQMTTSRDDALLKQIADWTEAQPDKMAVVVDESEAFSITKYLYDNQYAGTFSVCTRIASNYLDAALAGRCLTMAPGSETWALKTLAGVQTDSWSEQEYQDITALNGNTFEDYGSGIMVTFPGTCGDGESIEVVRFCFWQRDRIQKNLATLFINKNKIGHDPDGYEVVCANIESSLAEGQRAGGIMQDFADGDTALSGYTVTRPTMAEVTGAQRIKGDLTVMFEFYLRHAIKHVDAIGNAVTYGV
ncbi:DUF3383 family protein [Yersinia massiliensis]|uniref:DUF3383 family protein n=1 Tax=Yersinia massiliensis TaxID=419257 RepID=UPI001CFDCF3F|nr:DUF3383 family protein [Yersinia massiliensis]MCB5308349.1 DUF3383 domain-containing protein [Yersinia massiliensis]